MYTDHNDKKIVLSYEEMQDIIYYLWELRDYLEEWKRDKNINIYDKEINDLNILIDNLSKKFVEISNKSTF